MKTYGRIHVEGVEYYNPYVPPKKAKAVVREKPRGQTRIAGAYQDGYWTDYHYSVCLSALPKLPKGSELDEFKRSIREFLDTLRKDAVDRDTILGVLSDGKCSLGPLVQFLRAGFVRAAYVDHILATHPKAVPYHCPSPSCVVFVDGDKIVGAAVTVMNVELSDYLRARSEEALRLIEEGKEANI